MAAPAMSSAPRCQVCGRSAGESVELMRCAACKAVYYCSADHQKENWKAHKAACKMYKAAAASGFVKEIVVEGHGEPVGARKRVSIRTFGCAA